MEELTKALTKKLDEKIKSNDELCKMIDDLNNVENK